MAAINADKDVMEFFKSTATLEQTTTFIKRMQQLFERKEYCYFAVDKLENKELIGFIGLSEPNYVAPFTPCVDIGWRLKKSQWNQGFATEGALQCLDYGFNQLKLERIFATAPLVNRKSQHIMVKIGMTRKYDFQHPLLLDNQRLKNCVLFEKTQVNLEI